MEDHEDYTHKCTDAFENVPLESFLPAKYVDTDDIGKRAFIDELGFYNTEPIVELRTLQALHIKKGQKILDAGCGSGHTTALFAYLAGKEGVVHAIDKDEKIVEVARNSFEKFKAEHEGLELAKVEFICKNVILHKEEYDGIFIGMNIELKQLQSFASMITGNGTIVAVVENYLTRIRLFFMFQPIPEPILFIEEQYPLIVLPTEGEYMEVASDLCSELIEKHIHEKKILHSDSIIEALKTIPRHFFLPKDLLYEAYEDHPLSLLQYGFNMSAPHMYSICLEALQVRPGMKTLDIGSGTGHMTAVLGHLVGSEGLAEGLDLEDDFIEFSRNNVRKLSLHKGISMSMVKFFVRNVFVWTPDYLYDAIHCGACCPPDKLKDLCSLLAPNGVLITPVGDKLIKARRVGNDDDYSFSELLSVRYGELKLPSHEEVQEARKRRKDIQQRMPQLSHKSELKNEKMKLDMEEEKQAKSRENGEDEEKRGEEAEKEEAELVRDTEGENRLTCPICMDKKKCVAFNCGHLFCEVCERQFSYCPICRMEIRHRIKIFI